MALKWEVITYVCWGESFAGNQRSIRTSFILKRAWSVPAINSPLNIGQFRKAEILESENGKRARLVHYHNMTIYLNTLQSKRQQEACPRKCQTKRDGDLFFVSHFHLTTAQACRLIGLCVVLIPPSLWDEIFFLYEGKFPRMGIEFSRGKARF